MVLLYEDISYKIRGSIYKVYKGLGCGHKEKVYQEALVEAFKKENLKIEREKRIPVMFEGKKVGVYNPDFLVEGKVIIELKAKPVLIKQDIIQFWQYLTATDYRLGFLVNFGQAGGVQIIRRVYDKARK